MNEQELKLIIEALEFTSENLHFKAGLIKDDVALSDLIKERALLFFNIADKLRYCNGIDLT